jgi:beta-lactamase regulating signal transducer with metallopeptidase domain
MDLLLDLTLSGSAIVMIVVGLDRCLAARMSSRSRRWWWLFVPLAFLVPFRIPLLPTFRHLHALPTIFGRIHVESPVGIAAIAWSKPGNGALEVDLWLVGAFGYIALVVVQTVRASRRWSRERLSTDHALLELLEDCKAEAGVTAPIGLVVSNSISSPAILGWLHPRILLPASLVETIPIEKLRPTLLHELAHFRWFDVPFNWLLTLVRAVHWFNPLAHFGAIAWARFREEAADEAAVKWLRDESGQVYGDALVRLFREAQNAPPSGALAIVESVRHLKRRIALINRFSRKSPRILLTGVVSILLGVITFSKSASAVEGGAEKDAAASAQIWLREIDHGEYENGWKNASPKARANIGLDRWTAELKKVRTPLGDCDGRKEISFSFEKDPLFPTGVIEGEFAVLEFKSSFENADHLGETVILSEEDNGSWKVFGYYIHP